MPRGISQDDVFQAADLLLTRGERPTIERVRRTLGRGSPNTVNRLLDAWWQSLSERLHHDGTPAALPAPLLQQVETLYTEIRESAVRDAATTFSARETAMAEQAQTLVQQAAELDAQRIASDQAITALQEELAHLRERCSTHEAALGEVRDALSIAQQEAAHGAGMLNAANAERARLLEAHETERRRLRNQSDAQEKHWLSEIDRLRQELKLAKTETRKQTAALTQQRDELRKQAAHAQSAYYGRIPPPFML